MVVFKMHNSVPSASYSSVCYVLRQWSISLIPTYIYRVYRLYNRVSIFLAHPKWQRKLEEAIDATQPQSSTQNLRTQRVQEPHSFFIPSWYRKQETSRVHLRSVLSFELTVVDEILSIVAWLYSVCNACVQVFLYMHISYCINGMDSKR